MRELVQEIDGVKIYNTDRCYRFKINGRDVLLVYKTSLTRWVLLVDGRVEKLLTKSKGELVLEVLNAITKSLLKL